MRLSAFLLCLELVCRWFVAISDWPQEADRYSEIETGVLEASKSEDFIALYELRGELFLDFYPVEERGTGEGLAFFEYDI